MTCNCNDNCDCQKQFCPFCEQEYEGPLLIEKIEEAIVAEDFLYMSHESLPPDLFDILENQIIPMLGESRHLEIKSLNKICRKKEQFDIV